MGLTNALSTVVSGLSVNQEALAIIAQNISNANSENYTRREVQQSSVVLSGQAAGVQLDNVRRAVDDFLTASSRTQVSHVGKADTKNTFFERSQLLFGQPGANNDLNSAIDDFFASMSDLASTPEKSFIRAAALSEGIALAKKVQDIATGLEKIRFDADQEIATSVNTLNTLLEKLGALNTSIKEASRLGTDINALYDNRDALIEEVLEIVDVNVSISGTGETTLFIPGTELLGLSQKFKITYTAQADVSNMIAGDAVDEISIVRLDNSGNLTTDSFVLMSASTAATQEINFASGKLKGLVEIRDTDIPYMLAQLDEFAQTLTDTFNAIHNDGGGFPPASNLTGSRLLSPTDEYNFSGDVRIAVLNADGTPASDPFSSSGLRPLTLDLDRLNSGNGDGKATIQDVIDEINEYFGPPDPRKVTLGVLDEIKMTTVSSSITSTKASGTIQMLNNPAVNDTITINGTAFTFIAGASTGTNIQRMGSAADTVTEIARHFNGYTDGGTVDAATYTTSGNTLTITHNTSGTAPNGVYTIASDVTGVAVSGGGTLAGGANASGNVELDFEFTNIDDKNATFEVLGVSVNNGAAGLVGVVPAAYTSTAGLRERTAKDSTTTDTLTISLTGGNQGEGGAHTVSVQVRVTDGDGNITTETIDFNLTIPDPTDNIRNERYAITSGFTPVGNATVTTQLSNQRFATAQLVDANGVAVSSGESGYLKITTNQTGQGVMFDELNSSENGITSSTGTGTGFGFSHFFGLNDFFESGTTLKNSATNFDVRADYKADSSRIAAAELTLSAQPTDTAENPVYTYEMGIGSNQIASNLAALQFSRNSFTSAGTLPTLSLTFGGYAAEITSYNALRTSSSLDDKRQQDLLFGAFAEKQDAIGGVNIDEELANTILFQNNYTASARIINVISDMLETLMSVV